MLEVNAWDQHPYYSRAESMMDSLESRLHRCNFMTGGYLIRIFKGARQNVPDPDKTIKRVREQFEMHVYEMEDRNGTRKEEDVVRLYQKDSGASAAGRRCILQEFYI